MRGHEQIIAMRMARKAPSIVFLNDYPCKTDWADHGEHATVCTANDAIRNLDFRFLTGLRVSISATTEARAKELCKRIKGAGATTIAACHIQPNLPPSNQTGWTFLEVA